MHACDGEISTSGLCYTHPQYKQWGCTSKVIFGPPRNTTPIRRKEQERASSQHQRSKKLQTRYQPPDPIVPLARAYHQFSTDVTYYATKPRCTDLSITCAHIIYSRTISSLEDNLKMASKGQNMYMSTIVIKTS